jgi:DnaJ-class molecular chaperone
VKQAFLQAAMRYHPDLSRTATTGDDFVRIRQAFEQIVNNDDKDEDDDNTSPANWMEDVDLEPYFRHRTNEFLTFDMDDQTRKEVIQVYKTMSRGGNDKGGYWEMARQLAEREEVRGDAEKPHVRLLSTGSAKLNRRPKKR